MLGDETRLKILLALGGADGPLAFAELFERVEYDDTSNFNYHLKRLSNHFVHKTDDGYALRQAGRRVVEAVLAEAPAFDAAVERTRLEWPCFLCGAPIEMSYRQSHVGLYCPACGGTRGDGSTTTTGRAIDSEDVLGILDLPPAGVVDRTPTEVLETAQFWTTGEAISIARGVCPRCSAGLEKSVDVCEEHDASGGPCARCGQRFRLTIRHTCTNCIFTVNSPFATNLLDEPDLMGFMLDHGIDPLAQSGFHISALEGEEVLSREPLEVRFTYHADGEVLTLLVDEELSVVGVERRSAREPDR